jgi:hypothetical protein
VHCLRLIWAATLASLVRTPIAASADDAAPSSNVRPAEPALEKWPLAIAIGGGLNTSGHPTGEATFLPDLPGPYLSVGYSNSGEGRHVYAEGGVDLILNLAGGVGYHLDSTGASRWGFHVFAGLPLPLIGFGRDGASTPYGSMLHIAPLLLFVEPFYRPEFRRGAAVEHEIGLLLKMRVGLTKRQWSLPGFDLMAAFQGARDL